MIFVSYGKSCLVVMLILLAATIAPADDCVHCHQVTTAAAVQQWRGSAHARANVGCRDCHGTDHERMKKGEARVNAKVCGRCHAKALAQHIASRHGSGLHSGWGCTRGMEKRTPRECTFCHEEGSALPRSDIQCARFLKQSNEMGELGCNRCHQVENSCASCHANHSTDLTLVRNPAVCSPCHMGPDHPQWEMWQTSRHGIINSSMGRKQGPDCQTCHMPKGSHDVSHGLTINTGSIPLTPSVAQKGRSDMLAICGECHAPSFAARELALGDAVRDQGLALVKEAEEIITSLNDEEALAPMPDKRPPHPLSGNKLVLDAQMLYEDTSHIERLLFKMKKYDLAKSVKGAYHQNAAYTHWYGNAELKMDLVDIRSEAERLRERKGKGGEIKNTGGRSRIQEELELLKKREARGAITSEEYGAERRRLLKKFLDAPPTTQSPPSSGR